MTKITPYPYTPNHVADSQGRETGGKPSVDLSPEAMKHDAKEPDFKAAMLYHSDRADAYMVERDQLAARLQAAEQLAAALQNSTIAMQEAKSVIVSKRELLVLQAAIDGNRAALTAWRAQQ